MPCAQALMASMLSGMDVKDNDKVVWFDIVPNRPAKPVKVETSTFQLFFQPPSPFRIYVFKKFYEQARCAEFARAALKTLLDPAATGHQMQYVGLVREEKLGDIRTALESQVYDSWETCSRL